MPDPRITPDLLIPARRETPAVRFLFSQHQLSLEGESYPENTAKFYAPLMEALEAYLGEDGGEPVTLRLALTYMNSGSLKMVYRLAGRLNKAAMAGRPIAVIVEHDAEADDAAEFAGDLAADYQALDIKAEAKGVSA